MWREEQHMLWEFQQFHRTQATAELSGCPGKVVCDTSSLKNIPLTYLLLRGRGDFI
jgi:hypothetical protein